MKKIIAKNMKLVVICLSIILALCIIISLFLISKTNKENITNYEIVDEVVELPGTNIISNDNLSINHCLNDICVSDVTIYKAGNNGRLECSIVNNSTKTKTGYFKLVFPETYFIIYYDELNPGIPEKSIAQYTNKKLTDTSDYKLEELTKEEQKNIIK